MTTPITTLKAARQHIQNYIVDAPCNCPECIEKAKRLLPYLRRELKRIKKEGGAE